MGARGTIESILVSMLLFGDLVATREKTAKQEFVDVFSLLFRELEKKNKEGFEERDKEGMQRSQDD